ncbi:MAG TPA: NfeD family protein [Anaerolineae bacterium]|nr:NfeD family protein [Anaerolineae bacterium]HNU05362.1 NfeD family protein [Anaerolineae bacterium]
MSGLLDAANATTLNCIYFSSLVAGLILALASLVLSGLDGGEVGADVDLGGGDGAGDLTIFSPVTIGSFLAVFGAVGLITSVGFNMDARLSLLIAGLSAGVISLLIAALYSRLLIELHGSTNIAEAEMVGLEGVVTTPVPANGLGEVHFDVQNERMSRPARSAEGVAISRGSLVVIEQVLGAGVVLVRQRLPASQGQSNSQP